MPTMRSDQFEVVKEMLAEKDDIIAAQAEHNEDIEEELELALEENAALRLENKLLRSDRSFRD